MKLLVLVLLAIIVPAFAGIVQFGGHAGVFIPTGDAADFYELSPIFGLNFLANFLLFAIEGSVGYALLGTEQDLEDFSAHMIPILGGVRSYTGPLFLSGGLAVHISSVSYRLPTGHEFSDTDSRIGAYAGGGIKIPAMNIEAAVKYHLVDFDFDGAWISLTAGIYF